MLLKDTSKHAAVPARLKLRRRADHRKEIILRPGSDAVVAVNTRQADLVRMNDEGRINNSQYCELSILTQLCRSYLDPKEGGLIEYEAALSGFFYQQFDQEFRAQGKEILSICDCEQAMPYGWQAVDELVLYGDGLKAPNWRIDPSGSF